jgi:hypothetical protein
MNELIRCLDLVTMNTGHAPALRNLVFLVACIVLYGIYINLDSAGGSRRARRPLRCPDSILRG